MRPSTLAEACRRAQAGEDFELALGDFLQAYYVAKDIEARVPMLADEPRRFADKRYDALVGGIAPVIASRRRGDPGADGLRRGALDCFVSLAMT